MEIEFDLSLNGKTQIALTKHTIQNIDFITTKTHEYYLRHTRDIAMNIKFENADVLLRLPPSNSSGEGGETSGQKPDELDSVRNLLVHAITPHTEPFAYLDGEIRLSNEQGQIASFSYKDLFVLSSTEEYSEDSKNTYVNILLREKARNV